MKQNHFEYLYFGATKAFSLWNGILELQQTLDSRLLTPEASCLLLLAASLVSYAG